MDRWLKRGIFARNVEKRMKALGMNKAALARLSGTSRPQVSAHISRTAIKWWLPHPEQVEKYARALDCMPEDLMPNYQDVTKEPEVDVYPRPDLPLGWVMLKINKPLPMGVAGRVVDLLQIYESDIADRRGGL